MDRPGKGIHRLRWIFQADILNAGSTFVSDDLQYVNPVNCFIYDRSNHTLGYKITLSDIPEQLGHCNSTSDG